MNKHKTITLCLALTLLTACSKYDMKRADQAAEAYYTHLIEGKYDKYVQGIAYSDSMTDDYRRQMELLVAMHAEKQQTLRGGYLSARAVGDTVYGDLANVFLEITFADSTCEEISVPMICIDGIWKLQ